MENQMKWELDADGTLTIGGEGAIPDYYGKDTAAPWKEHADQVCTVVLCEGIRGVGARSFLNFVNLTSVVIPESVHYIHQSAFEGCLSLTQVCLPKKAVFRHLYQEKTVENGRGPIITLGCRAFLGTPWAVRQWGDFLTEDDLLLEYYGTEEVVQIPEGICRIGIFAFKERPVTSVIWPKSLRVIAPFAFERTRLTQVVLPEYITEIGMGSFADNPELTAVYCHNEDLKMSGQPFVKSPVKVYGYVPSYLQNLCAIRGIPFAEDPSVAKTFQRISLADIDNYGKYFLEKMKKKYIILCAAIDVEKKMVRRIDSCTWRSFGFYGDKPKELMAEYRMWPCLAFIGCLGETVYDPDNPNHADKDLFVSIYSDDTFYFTAPETRKYFGRKPKWSCYRDEAVDGIRYEWYISRDYGNWRGPLECELTSQILDEISGKGRKSDGDMLE